MWWRFVLISICKALPTKKNFICLWKIVLTWGLSVPVAYPQHLAINVLSLLLLLLLLCATYAGRTRAPLGHQENTLPLCGNLNAAQRKFFFVIQFKAHFLNSFTVINSIYNCHEVNKKPYTHHLTGIEDSSLLNISSIINFFIHDVLLRKQER